MGAQAEVLGDAEGEVGIRVAADVEGLRVVEHVLVARTEEKAYSTDANVLGATHEAKDLEHLSTSLEDMLREYQKAGLLPEGSVLSDLPLDDAD